MDFADKKIVVLGASRGLGRSLCENLKTRGARVMGVSRSVVETFDKWLSFDLAMDNQLDDLFNEIDHFKPEGLIYCAGGGPYGSFGKQKWDSHWWAFQLNLVTPAKLLHNISQGRLCSITQSIIIGSAIVENEPEWFAPSYSAAKVAIASLVKSLQGDPNNRLDIRIISPGYIDTEMLPKHCKPRQSGATILNPDKLANAILDWSLTTEGRNRNWTVNELL